jgi:hypothetical protein
MSTTLIATMLKSTANSSMVIKKTIFAFVMALTCLNPSMVLAQSNYELQQLVEYRQNYQMQANNLRTKMIFYMLSNPQATAAVLASGAGLAAFLEENLDSGTKAALLFAAAIGGGYCLDRANFQNCAEVAANLTGYAIEIDKYDRAINSISQQISSLQGQ